MSQKAWMQAYTKGSKSLQARLAKLHANNPEFQDFVKKHGFGGNLSVKQSGIQKKTSIGVQQTEKNAPTKGPVDREAMIRAAAEKLRDRKLAGANRAAFGGELGGGWSLPSMSFRTYREQKELDKPVKFDKPKPTVTLTKGELGKKREVSRAQAKLLIKQGWKKVNEEIKYKDASYTMRRGGWVVVRNGKTASIVLPTEDHAKAFIDQTRETLGHKVMKAIRMKAKSFARAHYATESKENRERILSYDSAVMTSKAKLPKLTADHKSKVIRKIIAHISNPKFSVVGKKYMNAALKLGESEMSSEKTLNELKKATMASYLAKAGGRVRSGTKIGLDFENDAYKDMAVANKHHPNMVTPGFEKSPEKLAKAEKSMKTNFDLANTFKRDAANRIKGIARAGRLLAKEDVEQLDERNTESHPDLWNSHELVHKSGKVLKKGDIVKGFRGHYKVAGFEMPHHSGSTGRVYVHSVSAKGRKIAGSGYGMDGKEPQSFFPSVIDAKIQKKAAVKEEVVNEVSRSTIAKVATARFNQAQKALKDKNYHEYVSKMRKAIKAGDATTPKTGWSPEDDPKNEEVVVEQPVVSPQEKYRQIREAKVRNARKGK